MRRYDEFVTVLDPIAEEIRGLMWDFYRSYKPTGDNDDGEDTPLAFRLHHQFGTPLQGDDVAIRKAKPHSQAPGDIPALSLAEKVREEVIYWAGKLHPVQGFGKTEPTFVWALENLADLTVGHPFGEEVLADFRSLRAQALIMLRFERAPVAIRSPGARCGVCGNRTLVQDPKSGDVYCSMGGPEGCHDDEQYPSCRALCSGCADRRDPACPVCWGQLPLVLCRRSERSMRHAWRVGHDRLHELTPGRAA